MLIGWTVRHFGGSLMLNLCTCNIYVESILCKNKDKLWVLFYIHSSPLCLVDIKHWWIYKSSFRGNRTKEVYITLQNGLCFHYVPQLKSLFTWVTHLATTWKPFFFPQHLLVDFVPVVWFSFQMQNYLVFVFYCIRHWSPLRGSSIEQVYCWISLYVLCRRF